MFNTIIWVVLFSGFRDLYTENKRMFSIFTLIITIGSISFGLSYPYFLPETEKIIGSELYKLLILGYLLIAPITYMYYRFNFKPNNTLSMIITINIINLLIIVLKIIRVTNLMKIFLITIPLSTALSAIYWIELQYLGYSFYSNHNRIRITTYTSTLFDITVLIGYFLSSIIYPNLILLFTTSLALNITLIITLLTIKVETIEKQGSSPFRIMKKHKKELFLYGLILLLYSTTEIAEPFLANDITQKYAGWLLMITSVMSIIIVNLGVIINLKDNTMKRELVVLLITGFILTLLSKSKLAIILYPIILPLFDSLSYNTRHKIIKQEDSENTHSIMIAGLMSYGALTPILLTLTLTNINYTEFITTAGVITVITSIMLLKRNYLTNNQ